jgi:hypothetical protein
MATGGDSMRTGAANPSRHRMMQRMEFEAKDLPEARAYMANWLANSGPLGEALQRARILDRGRVCVLVPSDTHRDLRQLEEGGLSTNDAGEVVPVLEASRKELVARMVQLREKLPSGTIVVQDPTPSRSDPWLARANIRSGFVGDSVYYPLGPEDSESIIAQTVRRADNYGTIIVLSALQAPTMRVIMEQEPPPGILDQVAVNSILLAIRAYDLEGWAIWTTVDSVIDA